MNAIEKAAQVLGSQKKLADILKVSKAAVNQWNLPGRRVPMTHCMAIEEATNGIVRCEDLRPDLNWVLLRQRNTGSSSKSEISPKTELVPHTTYSRSTNGDLIGTPLKRRATDKPTDDKGVA